VPHKELSLTYTEISNAGATARSAAPAATSQPTQWKFLSIEGILVYFSLFWFISVFLWHFVALHLYFTLSFIVELCATIDSDTVAL